MSTRKSNARRRSRGRASSESDSKAEGDTSSNVRVCVRVRPMNGAEREANNSKNVVRVLNENVLIFDPKEQESPSYFRGHRQRRNILKKKNRDMQFAFDYVFGEECQQQQVYEHTTKSIVDSLLNGYNCSVFAYGATGAGKTFTMLGAPGYPGITFLTMMELYKRIHEIREEKSCDVRVSYLEVYNENIRDLLVPSGYLAVREDPNKGVVVSGLSLQQPQSAEELLRMLEYGNQNRTQHPTDANAQSSRSHAVFQVFVKQKDRTANLTADFRVAKMSLIDLAGSERATVTTNRGKRLREGANINRSLLALGNCINALADKRNKKMHIPYRNSKLTRLLKDSLGGNCRTVMIAAISPSSLSYEDTYNTLKYANRAKEIKSNLKRNVVSVDFHVSRYQQIVAELRTEVTELKTKLQGYESGILNLAPRRNIDMVGEDEIQRLQGELHNVFTQRSSIRKELMELESSDRDLTVKIMRKQLTLERVRIVYGQTLQADKTMSKSERVIAASKARQGRLRGRKAEVEQRLKDNMDWLSRVEAEMRLAGKDGQMPEVLQDALRTRHLEIELKDSRRQIKHIKKIARQQDNQISSSEKLVLSLLAVVRKQYFLIKGAGLATADTDAEFETIQKAVEGDREVAWADQSVLGTDGETDGPLTNLKSLIELPILSCVNVTPRAPHLKLRDRERNTPSRQQLQSEIQPSQPNTPANSASITGQHVPQAWPSNTTPATQPPQRVLTPNQSTNIHQPTSVTGPAKRVQVGPGTPGPPTSKHQHINTPRQTPRTQHIGPPQRIEPPCVGPPTETPGHGAQTFVQREVKKQDGCHLVANEQNQFAKDADSRSSTDSCGSPVTDSCIKNLSLCEEFQVEGIAPLRTPPPTQDTSVASTELSNVAASQPIEQNIESKSGAELAKQPVARAISFDQTTGGSGYKISPVTGTTMTYAEVVNTPTRAAMPNPTRQPFGVLTNSPQLTGSQIQKAPALNESYTIKPAADDRRKSMGFREVATQPRPIKRRDTFTVKQAPAHLRSKSYNNLQIPSSSQTQRGSSRSVNTLQKYNLPSMMDQSSGHRKPAPAYMSMTASAANKRRKFGPSKENDDHGGGGGRGGFSNSRNGPGRVQAARRETMLINRPAMRNFGNSRRMTMSSSNLQRR